MQKSFVSIGYKIKSHADAKWCTAQWERFYRRQITKKYQKSVNKKVKTYKKHQQLNKKLHVLNWKKNNL